MTLEGFKGIFWWEYFHRLLGRMVGVVFLLPFLYFLARRRIDTALGWRFTAIFALGGLQGALGWYMVKSGLVDDPRVSQFRLAAHLGLAFLIYGAMLWVALGLIRGERERAAEMNALHRLAAFFPAVAFVTVLAGAIVASIRPGSSYNTFSA